MCFLEVQCTVMQTTVNSCFESIWLWILDTFTVKTAQCLKSLLWVTLSTSWHVSSFASGQPHNTSLNLLRHNYCNSRTPLRHCILLTVRRSYFKNTTEANTVISPKIDTAYRCWPRCKHFLPAGVFRWHIAIEIILSYLILICLSQEIVS